MTNLTAPDAPFAEFDAVRERYRVERERRTPGQGDRRYLDASKGFAHLLADPYTAPVERAAVDEEINVLVVGGGFGGLLSAARLREAGVGGVKIVEAGGDVGGTWYWNRYPGAACDIESYIYFPLLEETGYMPVERYSKAPEIRAHAGRIAERFDLYKDTLLSTQVRTLDWDKAEARWRVTTDRGDRIAARFVVLATGPLNRPKLPAIPGVDTFKGQTFHTSRWDYAYTGGSATEPMTGLVHKRVGIIGTGATAVQCVPPLARDAQHLFVFQRTPSSVDLRHNRPTDPEWAASLEPGWQQRRMENFTEQMAGRFERPDEVADGWTVLAKAVREMVAADPAAAADIPALIERADMEKMVQVRAQMDSIVQDPKTAEALKPWFSLFCKRPCFHDDYLAVFNRPNVTLVDTEGRGVERITETGVVVGGRSYELDCLIFATGFETATDYSSRSGFNMRGENGVSLTEKWAAGLATLHGMHTRGFPNCFILSQSQAGMSPNFPHMLSEQARHLTHIVDYGLKHDVKRIEPSEQAEAAWVDSIVEMGAERIRQLQACTPGYYNGEGRITSDAARNLPFGEGPVVFIDLLKAWRDCGDFAGLELDGAALSSSAAA